MTLHNASTWHLLLLFWWKIPAVAENDKLCVQLINIRTQRRTTLPYRLHLTSNLKTEISFKISLGKWQTNNDKNDKHWGRENREWNRLCIWPCLTAFNDDAVSSETLKAMLLFLTNVRWKLLYFNKQYGLCTDSSPMTAFKNKTTTTTTKENQKIQQLYRDFFQKLWNCICHHLETCETPCACSEDLPWQTWHLTWIWDLHLPQ